MEIDVSSIPLKTWTCPRRVLFAVLALVVVGPPVTAATPVDRGRYLAVAGNCGACHTVPGQDHMGGGVAFATPFGLVHSTNISPHPDLGIGSWNAEQFRLAMRRGIAPGGKRLYPVFPYTHFTQLSDEDIDALFAYLMSVPPSARPAEPNSMRFPFGFRPLLAVWNSLFLREGPLEILPAEDAEWNRGRYLVQAVAHCGACHTPRNFLGGERRSLAMTGASYLDEVAPGLKREWQSANLTRHATGLGRWSAADLVSYLKDGFNVHTSVNGPMRKVVMEGTRQLNPEDLQAMARYLHSLEANAQRQGGGASARVMQRGSRLYTLKCARCHLAFGEGGPETGPALAGNPTVQAAGAASLVNVILYGPLRPEPPIEREWDKMQGYHDSMSDDEIADLASFLRRAWGNSGSAVSASEVARQR